MHYGECENGQWFVESSPQIKKKPAHGQSKPAFPHTIGSLQSISRDTDNNDVKMDKQNI